MDQPRRARRGPRRDVVLLDEGGPHPARCGIQEAPVPTMPPPTMTTSHVSAVEGCQVATHDGPTATVRAGVGRVRHGAIVRPDAARDAPQPPAGPDDQHEDQQRRVEDDLLDLCRQQARGDGKPEDDRHDTDGHDEHLAPARLASRSVAGSATVGLGRDADRGHQDPSRVGGALPGDRGRSWLGGRSRSGPHAPPDRTARRWRDRAPSACRRRRSGRRPRGPSR